jgi:hypothetical protein
MLTKKGRQIMANLFYIELVMRQKSRKQRNDFSASRKPKGIDIIWI